MRVWGVMMYAVHSWPGRLADSDMNMWGRRRRSGGLTARLTPGITQQTRAQCGVVKDLRDDGDHTPGTHPSHDTHGHMGTHGYRATHHRIAMTRRKLGQLWCEGVWHEVSQGDFILKYALYMNLHFILTGTIAPIFLPAFIRMVHVAPNYGSEVTNHKIKKYTQSRGKSSANNIPL